MTVGLHTVVSLSYNTTYRQRKYDNFVFVKTLPVCFFGISCHRSTSTGEWSCCDQRDVVCYLTKHRFVSTSGPVAVLHHLSLFEVCFSCKHLIWAKYTVGGVRSIHCSVCVYTGASGQVPMVTERYLTVCAWLHLCVCLCVWPIIAVDCYLLSKRFTLSPWQHGGHWSGEWPQLVISYTRVGDGGVRGGVRQDWRRQDKKMTDRQTARQDG